MVWCVWCMVCIVYDVCVCMCMVWYACLCALCMVYLWYMVCIVYDVCVYVTYGCTCVCKVHICGVYMLLCACVCACVYVYVWYMMYMLCMRYVADDMCVCIFGMYGGCRRIYLWCMYASL